MRGESLHRRRLPLPPGLHMIREMLMILFVTCATLGSQLLIKRAVLDLATRAPGLKGLDWMLAAVTSPPVIAAVALQGLGFLVWVVVVSRVKLGVAFAMSGASFYILLAAASWWFYGERLAPGQWLGLILISTGVLLVGSLGRPV